MFGSGIQEQMDKTEDFRSFGCGVNSKDGLTGLSFSTKGWLHRER